MSESVVKYQQDPEFRALVDFLVLCLVQTEGYTTEELCEATELVQNIYVEIPTTPKRTFIQ